MAAKKVTTKKKLAQQRVKFTVARIRNLAPRDRPYPVYDAELKGLRVMIYPTGTRVFQVYMKPAGSNRPVTVKIATEGQLALNGSGLTPVQREKGTPTVYSQAQEAVSQLQRGINPNERKKAEIKQKAAEAAQEKASGKTLREALEEYLELKGKARGKKKALAQGTQDNYRRAVERNLSEWADTPLVNIMRADVREMHAEISEEHPAAANDTMSIFKILWNFVAEDIAEQIEEGADLEPMRPCPIVTLSKKDLWNPKKARTGWIIPEHFAAWWAATEKLTEKVEDEDGILVPAYRGDGQLAQDYLRFVVLTGVRRREATGLTWKLIDLQAKTFKITEGMAKNKTAIELPLCDYLVQMLERRKEDGAKKPFDLDEPRRFVNRVRDWSGVEFTVHDLRRTFAKTAGRLNIHVFTQKGLLNHSLKGDVTSSNYDNDIDMARLREASNKIVNALLSLAEVNKTATVVSLEERRRES